MAKSPEVAAAMSSTAAPVGSEANPGAPSPRVSKGAGFAEPAFENIGNAPVRDTEVMDVNPTPRSAREDGMNADGTSPFSAGKTGPQLLTGEDLARRGGGPDQRVEERQAKLTQKFREDKGVQKLMRDESLKRFGEIPGAAPDKSAEEARAETAAAEETETTETGRSAKDIDEIAKLSRERRELRDSLRAANGAKTEAKRSEMLKELAKEYPAAAAAAWLGEDPDAYISRVYQDDVKGKSKSAGDRIKVDPEKALGEDERLSKHEQALQAERAEKNRLASELQEIRVGQAAANIVQSDTKRWELCAKTPDIGTKLAAEVSKVYRESDAAAGGNGKGWRPKDAKEQKEFVDSLLDDMEKGFEEVGKRYSRTPAAPAARRPAPPPGQRPVAQSRTGADWDRYAKPPKRESVEDRQDAMIARYRGRSMTTD